MHEPHTTLAQRLQRLDVLLADYAWLWRPQPFKEARPPWCDRLPELTHALMEMTEDELTRVAGDHLALIRLVARYVPALAELHDLTRLPAWESTPTAGRGSRLNWQVPGRKWAQIEAFADALGPMRSEVVEWCGGKGHLGRLLASRWDCSIVTVDHDAGLCADGERLARRARVKQSFSLVDARSDKAAGHLSTGQAIALHACGELHRVLARRAVSEQVPALDIAPCCYHHGAGATYEPLSPSARLTLTRDDLRLAVTETATSAAREVRRRDLEMAWKLGFGLLRQHLTGDRRYVPIKPVAKEWLNLGFEGFCRALAARDKVDLPKLVDWSRFEKTGWRRQHETMRLSLPRFAFRRPLEIWLVLDLANFLANNGYSIRMGTFCNREISPRNILLSARLASKA